MAETRLTNVIVPDIFTAYTLERSIYRSRLWMSGIIQDNPGITGLLNGGGTTFNLPFWQDISGTSGDNPSETVAQTVNPITAGQEIARRQFRTKAWGQNAIAATNAGTAPLTAIEARVINYWAQAYDLIGIATVQGVIADNIANDSGDLVNDISSATVTVFNDDGVIDTQALLGENGTIGRPDQTDFAAIVVHPATYALMRKQDLIDFVPVSDQERPIELYMNMRVVVDRNAPVSSNVYDTYIFKPGAIVWGLGTANYEATELDRVPLQGFGIDQLITRRVFAIHPVGFQWTNTTVSDGITPTDAELQLAVNWDRVYQQENAGFVMFRHRLT